MTTRQTLIGLLFIASILVSSYIRKSKTSNITKSVQYKIDSLDAKRDSTYITIDIADLKYTTVYNDGVYVSYPKELEITLNIVKHSAVKIDSVNMYNKVFTFHLKDK